MNTLLHNRATAVLAIEKVFPRVSQDRARGLCLMVLAGGAMMLTVDRYLFAVSASPVVLGGIIVVAGVYLELCMLRLFVNSVYYSGLASKTGKGNYHQTGITYDVASVLASDQADMTRSFLSSTFGTHIYVRCELTQEVVAAWLASDRQKIPAATLYLHTERATTLIDVVDCILTHDTAFTQFLSQHGVTADTVRGTAALVFSAYYESKRAERWWSRDALSQRGSLGRTLTLGAWREYVPYTTAITPLSTLTATESLHYITHMSEVLQAKRDSNLVMIAPDEATSLTLVAHLQHALTTGTALGGVNSMSLITIDHDDILATQVSTIAIEAVLREILGAAEQAGNMTVVVSDLTNINNRYLTRGVQFMHILEEFMTASQVHVILVTTPGEYGLIRKDALTLIKRCHEIIIEPLSVQRMTLLLAPELFRYETTTRTIMSYPALLAIAEVALTYDAPTLESGRRLLITVIEHYHNQPLITRDLTLAHLGSTLNVPLGPIGEVERDVLLSLEGLMHQTIVGQERALGAISSALRRRRANLIDTTEPFASFLFLGPSGVGKTETAKTIARVYFGGEASMMRLDMSEYAEAGSTTRLLGLGAGIGVLEQHLANHPRGLILLDEFEKAHPDVTELFLQILDEGSITTSSGTVLSFRPHMIIATSNAGSDLIARTSQTRALTPVLDSDVIAHITQKQILSSELIGRFSDVILFDALTPTDELTIAEQILTTLKHKTEAQGFALAYEAGIGAAIVARAHDAQFGARPLRHAIEHTIEDIIATKIIRGDIRRGDTITITVAEVAKKGSH
jgi:ABC-type multidrug transport system fused ATPase/permease subunit